MRKSETSENEKNEHHTSGIVTKKNNERKKREEEMRKKKPNKTKTHTTNRIRDKSDWHTGTNSSNEVD